MKVGDPQHFRWLEGILAAVFILNVMDGILTLVWLFTGRAVESNPLMAHVIEISPVLFIVLKTTLVGLSTALLWRYRHRPLAVVGLFLGFIVYYAILLVHLRAMNLDILQEWLRR